MCELSHDGIVVDLVFHLTILLGELLIFVLHLFLVEFGKLLHVLVHFFLLVKTCI